MPSSVINGAWPGNTPRYPFAPGKVTSRTRVRSNCRVGVTITRSMSPGSTPLNSCLHLFRFLQGFLNCTHHIKCLLRNIIVLAFDDFLEAAHSVFDLDVLAFQSG